MTYVGPLKRFFAFVIDTCCIFFLYFLTGMALAIEPLRRVLQSLPMVGFWWFGALFLIAWLYNALFESSSLQGTIGKKIMQIKVVDQLGKKISFLRATSRFFGKIVSRILFGVGFLLIFFTKKKQTLHDKIASTYIILKKE
ncbi:MAG: RDD family protein [Chlamydiae bacterium]|nr:RDD family protein [Chlamydiota bacterium]